MKQDSEETILNNDFTAFSQSGTSEETILNESTMDSTSQEAPASEQKKQQKGWKSVLIGGVPGIALGAAGMMFMSSVLPPDANTEAEDQQDTQTPNKEHHAATTPEEAQHEIPFADGITDNMTFSEAFAAAREDVGPGGAFVWHGQVYGTYYGNEWNALSPQEQSQFTADAIASQNDIPSTPNSIPNNANDVAVNSAATEHPADVPNVVTAEAVEAVDTQEVYVLGTESDVEIEDGLVVDMGYALVDGHAAVFIDVDQDSHGEFDLAMIDRNDSGSFEENEIEIMEPGSGMNMDAFEAAAGTDPNADMYASSPDYANDADISSFS